MPKPVLLFVVLMVVGATGAAETAPAGWKVVTDRKETCRMMVPSDWTAGVIKSLPQSPDRMANAAIHGSRPGETWDQVITSAKRYLKPERIIEDSPKRLWYEYSTGVASATNWYVAVPGKNIVCTAQIYFRSSAYDQIVRRIVNSIAPLE